MKTIQVYAPPMCCSTGVCGTGIDPALVKFSATLSQLGTHGIQIERYNLGQQPMAFAQNPSVKALLDKGGPEVLLLIFLDGEVHLKGRYPTSEERPASVRWPVWQSIASFMKPQSKPWQMPPRQRSCW